MMGIQHRTNDFIRSFSQRARDIAEAEIFTNGIPDNKLAIEHLSPILYSANVEYTIRLVCRVTYKRDGSYKSRVLYSSSVFTAEQVLSGGSEWPSIIEAIAYPMIKALKNKILELEDVSFIPLRPQLTAPYLRRVIVKSP